MSDIKLITGLREVGGGLSVGLAAVDGHRYEFYVFGGELGTIYELVPRASHSYGGKEHRRRLPRTTSQPVRDAIMAILTHVDVALDEVALKTP